MASNTLLTLLATLAMFHSLPSLHGLPLRSTTVHQALPSGRVRSHGGFLGGYGFKITGLTRSYNEPHFVLRGQQQKQQRQRQESHRFEVEEELPVVEKEGTLPVVEEARQLLVVEDIILR